MFISKNTLALWCATISTAAAFSTPPAFVGRTLGTTASAAGTSCTVSFAIRSMHIPGHCTCHSCSMGTILHRSSALGCSCPACRGVGKQATTLFANNNNHHNVAEETEKVASSSTTITTASTTLSDNTPVIHNNNDDVKVDVVVVEDVIKDDAGIVEDEVVVVVKDDEVVVDNVEEQEVEDDEDTSTIPIEVFAMDGVETDEEAHNVERPARQQLRKKKTKNGTELSELQVGSTVSGTVRSITTYGAFVDIGATNEGLLHISKLSKEYVGNVSDVLSEGQQVQVRIINIDTVKGQIGLSMMTAEESEQAQQAAKDARGARNNNRRQSNNNNSNDNNNNNNTRGNNSAILESIQENGWDTEQMIEGTVASITDFGAFVRMDASSLNTNCEGEFDGLVHISALQSGRVNNVADVVTVNEKVQVRVKSIDGNKVSLTMLSAEDDAAKAESAASNRGGRFDEHGPGNGPANWKELLVNIDAEMPTFENFPVVEDRRN